MEQNSDLNITKGIDVRFYFIVTETVFTDGALVTQVKDLTNYKIEISVKKNANDAAYILGPLSGVIFGDTSGIAYIDIITTDSKNLVADIYTYKVIISEISETVILDEKIISRGKFTIKE